MSLGPIGKPPGASRRKVVNNHKATCHASPRPHAPEIVESHWMSNVGHWDQRLYKLVTSYHHAKPHFYRLQVFLCGASKCIFCLFFLGGRATTHLCVFLLGFIGKKKPLLSMIFCRIISGVCFWGGLSQPLTNPLPCDFRETPQGCLRCCMRIRVSTKMSCKIHSCNLFNWATSWKPGRILSIESHIAVY